MMKGEKEVLFSKRKQQVVVDDVELQKRTLEGNVKKLVAVLAICLSVFQLSTAVFGIYKTAVVHRAVHLAIVLFLFLSYIPARKLLMRNYGSTLIY